MTGFDMFADATWRCRQPPGWEQVVAPGPALPTTPEPRDHGRLNVKDGRGERDMWSRLLRKGSKHPHATSHLASQATLGIGDWFAGIWLAI